MPVCAITSRTNEDSHGQMLRLHLCVACGTGRLRPSPSAGTRDNGVAKRGRTGPMGMGLGRSPYREMMDDEEDVAY